MVRSQVAKHGAAVSELAEESPEPVAEEVLADDPARGVYWGPPDAYGLQRRWSRAWWEWRDE